MRGRDIAQARRYTPFKVRGALRAVRIDSGVEKRRGLGNIGNIKSGHRRRIATHRARAELARAEGLDVAVITAERILRRGAVIISGVGGKILNRERIGERDIAERDGLKAARKAKRRRFAPFKPNIGSRVVGIHSSQNRHRGRSNLMRFACEYRGYIACGTWRNIVIELILRGEAHRVSLRSAKTVLRHRAIIVGGINGEIAHGKRDIGTVVAASYRL